MKIYKRFRYGLTLFVSLFCLVQVTFANSTNSGDDRFNNITLNNQTGNLETNLRQRDGNVIVTVDKLSETDYGSGLLRTIFGDFKEAFCFGDECKDGHSVNVASGSSNPVSESLYANVFLPQTQLSKMFSKALNMSLVFSLAVIAFLVFFGFFYAVLHTASTANQRSLNNIYTNIIFHARWVIVLVMLFPTSSGYSLGILGMMKLMGYSNAMANVVYANALSSIDEKVFEQRLEQTIKDRMKSTNDNSMLMRNLLMSSYCLYQMNNNQANKNLQYGTVLGIKDHELTLNFGPARIGSPSEISSAANDYSSYNQGTASYPDNNGMNGGYTNSSSSGIGRLVVGRTMFVPNPEGVNIHRYSEVLGNISANYCGAITLPLTVVESSTSITDVIKVTFNAIFNRNGENEFKSVVETVQQKNRYSWAQLQGVLVAMDKAYKFFEQKVGKNGDGRTFTIDSTLYAELNKTLISMESEYYTTVRKIFSDSGLGSSKSTNKINVGEIFQHTIDDVNVNKLTKGLDATFADSQFSSTAKVIRQHVETMIEMGINQRAYRLGITDVKFPEKLEELLTKVKADKTNDVLLRVTTQAVQNGWISAGANFNALIGISAGYNAFSDYSPTYTSPASLYDDTEKNDKDIANANVSDHSRINRMDYNRILLATDPTGFELYDPVVKLESEKDKKALNKLSYEETESYFNHIRAGNRLGIKFANMLGYNPYRELNELYVYKHPILSMKDRGDTMLFVANAVLFTSAGLDFIANSKKKGKNDPEEKQQKMTEAANMLNSHGNSTALGGTSGFIDLMTSIINSIKNISVPIAWLFLFIGAVFSVYLPLLPTLYWIFGVLTWTLSFIINIVALPVAAFGILMAKGQDFFGRAIAFMLMFIETNLRPSLMIVGLFATGLMSATFMDLAVRLLDLAYMNTSSNEGVISAIIYGFVRCFFEYQILVNCCSLIITIPQRVIAHVQGSTALEDSAETQSNRLMGAISQGRHEITGVFKRA